MCWLLVASLFPATPVAYAQTPQDPASKRQTYLLLDSRIVDTVRDAELKLGTVTKHPANPLFGRDKPWEVNLDNLYPNVAYDDSLLDGKGRPVGQAKPVTAEVTDGAMAPCGPSPP